MLKTGACFFFFTQMTLLFVFSPILVGLFVSSVNLQSTGTITMYSISRTGSVTNVVNITSGDTVYSNANDNLAFSAAFGYVKNGGSIAVQTGVYTANGSSVMMQGCSNVNVIFLPGSLLTITDNANVPVFEMRNCSNCVVSGINIDGNAAKQTNWLSDGIMVYNSKNCLVTEANITNVRIFGYATTSEFAQMGHSNGITDSVVSDCGWNNIQLGMEESYTTGAYAINNTCSNAGDVGIACYGVNCYVANNYIYNITGMNATVNSHIGVSVEWGGYNTIVNNTIVNCTNVNGGLRGTGICVGTGTALNYSCLVKGNRITNCQSGIVSAYSGFDVITENQITNCGIEPNEGYRVSCGIASFSSFNTTISFNTFFSDSQSNLLGPSIYLTNTPDAIVRGNTITTQLSAQAYGIILEAYQPTWGPARTLIQNNTLQAYIGVFIDVGCVDVNVLQNNLSKCSTPITDLGTGTIIG